MKKKFVAALLLTMLFASPVFAQLAVSGEFTYEMNADMVNEDGAVSSDAEIHLTYSPAIGDSVMLDAKLSADSYDNDWGVILNTDRNGVRGLYLNQVSMTQDVVAAIGMDLPVGISYKVGLFDYMPGNPSTVAGHNDLESNDGAALIGHTESNLDNIGNGDFADSNLHVIPGAQLMLGLMPDDMVNLNAVLYPGTFDKNNHERIQMGFDVNGMIAAGPATVSYVAYTAIAWANEPDDYKTEGLGWGGVSVGASLLDNMLDVGLLWEMDSTLMGTADSVNKLGISAAYTMDNMLKAGLAFNMKDLTDQGETGFAANSEIYVNATYTLMENFDIIGAFGVTSLDFGDYNGDGTTTDEFDFQDSAHMQFEVAARYMLDGVNLTAGYTHNGSDFVAYTGSSANSADADGIFFQVNTAF